MRCDYCDPPLLDTPKPLILLLTGLRPSETPSATCQYSISPAKANYCYAKVADTTRYLRGYALSRNQYLIGGLRDDFAARIR
jgi:hypothetical protein